MSGVAPDRGGRLAARAAGPLAFAAIMAIPAPPEFAAARGVGAAVAWMAVWWVTEAAPLAVTSMLPLVLFPLLGVRGVREVAPRYGDHMVFLFLGGFVLAVAVERSGLHRRLALSTLAALGGSARRQVMGFLLVSAGLSMWLSNTATVLMLLPVAAGVADRLPDRLSRTRLFLAVAYGASIGGLGTLIGTPPNGVLAGMAPRLVPGLPQITFGGWMVFAVPLVACLLPVAALLLGRGLRGGEGAAERVREELAALGPRTPRELRAGALFLLTAMAWITRGGFDLGAIRIPGWADLLPDPGAVSDAVPAVAAAVAAALVPAGGGTGRSLASWDEVRHGVPWGVLLLFGGGFALADAVRASGLDRLLAEALEGLGGLPLPLLILALALVAMVATEFTSNTATATLLMPVMAALAAAMGRPPYLLMVPAVVACSCAFMLPVATPPNAIVIGSGHVTARELFAEGVRLNAAAAVLITLLTLTLGRLVLPLG